MELRIVSDCHVFHDRTSPLVQPKVGGRVGVRADLDNTQQLYESPARVVLFEIRREKRARTFGQSLGEADVDSKCD